jgi:hypothetical protein
LQYEGGIQPQDDSFWNKPIHLSSVHFACGPKTARIRNHWRDAHRIAQLIADTFHDRVACTILEDKTIFHHPQFRDIIEFPY